MHYYPPKKNKNATSKTKIDTDITLEEFTNKGVRSSPIKRKKVNYNPHNYQKNIKKKISTNYYVPLPQQYQDEFDNSFEIPDPIDSEYERLILNRQEKHISLENKKDLNEFENNPLIEAGRKINEELLDLKMSDPCRICDECWYDLKIGPKNKMCQRCYNENKNMRSDPDVEKILKFSEENDMHPDMVPDCIKNYL